VASTSSGHMVQEVGHAKLRERGIDLIAADSFIDDTPTAKLVRQVLGAISEFDKAMTVAKLRGARERKRREAGKCEGRKSHAERNPELVALAKRLHRQRPKGGRLSLPALGLGETIELQDDADVVGQQRDLDPAPQPAQRERHHGLPQLRRLGDVAAPLVEGHSDLKPLITHWYLRIVPRDRSGWACGAGCKARTRTDEGAILP
jgi:Resolvase, N terminal domain